MSYDISIKISSTQPRANKPYIDSTRMSSFAFTNDFEDSLQTNADDFRQDVLSIELLFGAPVVDVSIVTVFPAGTNSAKLFFNSSGEHQELWQHFEAIMNVQIRIITSNKSVQMDIYVFQFDASWVLYCIKEH